MQSIVDVTMSALRGNTLERVSAQLRESPEATRRGVEQAVPISIAGLAEYASTEPGAEALLGTLHSGKYPRMEAGEMAQIAMNPDDSARVARSGTGFLSQLFGDRLGGIVDTLAGQSGVSKSSAATLLGLSAPMVLSAVGREAHARNFDARDLSRYLSAQESRATGSPAHLSSLFGARRPAAARVEPHRREGRPGRGPLIAGAIALVAVLAFLVARRGQAPEAMEQVGQTAEKAGQKTEEAGERAAGEAQGAAGDVERTAGVAEGEVEQVAGGGTHGTPEQGAEQAAGGAVALSTDAVPLANFLAGDAQTPQRFTLEGVDFAPASARVTGSKAQLDQVAEALRSHESARVRIEGHTDSTGDPQQNVALSEQRASAVKNYLVDDGIAAERIETGGSGAQQPVASNETEQGRAENRRVDLIVTAR